MFSLLRARTWNGPGPAKRRFALALVLTCVLAGCGRIRYDDVSAPDAGREPDADLVDEDGGPEHEGGASDEAGSAGSDAGASPDGDAGEDANARDAAYLTGAIDLADVSQIVVLNAAALNDAGIVLTRDVQGTVGAAYLRAPYPVTPSASFSVRFSFRIGGAFARRGDGLALLWQNDPRRTESIGTPGGGMGYNGISPSVAVELDVLANAYDARGNQVAVTTNGNYMTALAEGPAPFSLDDGATHYVWVEYEGATNLLSVFVADAAVQPASPLLMTSVDFPQLLGTSAFLGFTAGSGNASELAVIESVSVDYRP